VTCRLCRLQFRDARGRDHISQNLMLSLLRQGLSMLFTYERSEQSGRPAMHRSTQRERWGTRKMRCRKLPRSHVVWHFVSTSSVSLSRRVPPPSSLLSTILYLKHPTAFEVSTVMVQLRQLRQQLDGVSASCSVLRLTCFAVADYGNPYSYHHNPWPRCRSTGKMPLIRIDDLASLPGHRMCNKALSMDGQRERLHMYQPNLR